MVAAGCGSQPPILDVTGDPLRPKYSSKGGRMLKTAFNVYLVAFVLSFSISTHAREVTAVILSSPSGATISDNGQVKPKVLGKTPLRITVEAGSIDYQRGVLQTDRYSAKWPSGAISKLLTYRSPISETEFIYSVERPPGVAGEAKDKAAGDAHNKTPNVAAENQVITAKIQLWTERVASYKKQKEYEAQVEEMTQQRAAAEARQQAANEAQARRAAELRAQQMKDEERARAHWQGQNMPRWVGGQEGFR